MLIEPWTPAASLYLAAPLHPAALSGPLLDPPTRAVLLMALLGFVVLGIGLIAGALLGGHWARRQGDELTRPLPLNKPSQPETLPPSVPTAEIDSASD